MMEQLRAELSHLLGEKLSRVECVSEKPSSALWSLYDAQGNPMPLLAKSFTTPVSASRPFVAHTRRASERISGLIWRKT